MKIKFLSAGLLMLVSMQVLAGSNITVYKSPTCGCCKKWITHLEQNGFKVKSVDMQSVTSKKIEFGITPMTASCHTGVIDGYVVEGHVPAKDIKRLLKEKPKGIKGLSVPGMPIGSPGMEQGDRKDKYDVLSIDKNGKTSVFSSY
ncbi:MAG: DUF411 domain-containing protein [Gammaproteobacteria bacterium]|nr:DUF411 domain-containing protein [Gammaproteobacteria bacterium]MDH5778803.1 DUF411 domain-containing protein [Gammaproteobacteria bacterium]